MEIVLFILKCLFYTISCIVAFYFLLPVVLFTIYILKCGTKKNQNKIKIKSDHLFNYAAIITAHQDSRFIAPFADSFIKQNYRNFKVYVVADDCNKEQLPFFDERIVILHPPIALHSKIKSIQFAINNFNQAHDILIIFDSDNLVHPDYLTNLNSYFQDGFKVVQTHMLSKNIDNTYARLDSIGHIYYTFYERKVKMKLGLSSAILGLGIAIDLNLYKEIGYQNTIGGFDKKLQSQLARKVKQIAFAEDAKVYDEKVEDASVLEKQRTRWIYSYFNHFKESWLLTICGIKNFNLGQILLGASMLRPPIIILLLLLIIILLFTFFINPLLVFWWELIILLFTINFILTIATQSHQKGMLQSLKYLPLLMISQFKALFKINKAKQNFLKTEHKKVIYIDELLKNEFT